MAKYRIKAPKAQIWRKHEICEFGISPGHLSHEGDKLESLLDWGQKNFSKCIINLSDSLYRHNYQAAGLHEIPAYKASLEAGEKWIFQNKKILDNYKNFIEKLFRWDRWIYHADYSKIKSDIDDYYKNNAAFRESIQEDIKDFLDRKIRQGAEIDLNNASIYFKNYLLEEASCYVIIGRSYNPARIYPGKDLKTFEHLRLGETPTHLMGMEKIPHIEVSVNRKPGAFKDEQAVA